MFDAAARMGGRCLNDYFLQGPDNNNALRALLMRFRMRPVAFTADIQNMFHQFFVPAHQRTYLRFFWFEDNDHTKELVEYYACVHLQGLTGSPAIADVCRRFASKKHVEDCPVNLEEFRRELKSLSSTLSKDKKHRDRVDMVLSNQFYVDDILASENTSTKAVTVLEQGIERLDFYHVTLCKISSNDPDIRARFSTSTSLPEIVEFSSDGECPSSRPNVPEDTTSSLGLRWNTRKDYFQIKTKVDNRPYTKRGLLSHLMKSFDPLGFISPALLKHRLLQRLIIPKKNDDSGDYHKLDWDDPLPECISDGADAHLPDCSCGRDKWNDMLQTIASLESVTIPRCVFPGGQVKKRTLLGYADASEIAIAYAIYVKTELVSGPDYTGFVTGQSRVIPTGTFKKGAISIPRAELCAAQALARAMLQVEHDLGLDVDLAQSEYFTDSRDVMDWISNEHDSFPRYVTSRRNYILQVSNASQWSWLPGLKNPADVGTRPISVSDLVESRWLKGPDLEEVALD